jgi:LemA protein
MKQIKTSWIVLAVCAVLVFWAWSSYNSLVKGTVAVDVAWAQVETQYQRRLDLIPSLVASVQGVLKQEKDVFGALATARQGYAGAKTIDQKVAAAGQVESALSRLLVITENYPQLRSSDSMQTLMTQLEGTENRISVERSRFNEIVGAYNLQLRTFPSNIVAKIFGFEVRKTFDAAAGADKAPEVKFN